MCQRRLWAGIQGNNNPTHGRLPIHATVPVAIVSLRWPIVATAISTLGCVTCHFLGTKDICASSIGLPANLNIIFPLPVIYFSCVWDDEGCRWQFSVVFSPVCPAFAPHRLLLQSPTKSHTFFNMDMAIVTYRYHCPFAGDNQHLHHFYPGPRVLQQLYSIGIYLYMSTRNYVLPKTFLFGYISAEVSSLEFYGSKGAWIILLLELCNYFKLITEQTDHLRLLPSRVISFSRSIQRPDSYLLPLLRHQNILKHPTPITGANKKNNLSMLSENPRVRICLLSGCRHPELPLSPSVISLAINHLHGHQLLVAH